MPSDKISDYAAGQAQPVWPQDKPLALTLGHFVPAREGHPPAGAVPQDIIPEGQSRPKLFDPLVRLSNSNSGLALKNRVIVSPMCQYSAQDGFPSVWHLSHLGSWALHGVGSIMVEASGVTPAGRITPQCLGIWKDEHIDAHASLVSALRTVAPGLTVGIQLAHAGRKASTWSPYHRGEKQHKDYVTDAEGGWERDVVAPSAIAYGDGWITPRELSTQEMEELQQHFIKAADRAFQAGYDFVELHAAHGYFFHSCLSPLSNKRTDAYGGSFEGRTKLLLDTVRAIRSKYPNKSLWVRVSGTDFAEHVEAEGTATWNGEETKKLAPLLDAEGVDVLDVSAGGLVPFQKISPKPAYQLAFAAGVKQTQPKKMLVGAVGMMEGDEYPGQVAEDALQRGDCDLILLARGMMADPAWTEHAATELMGVRCAGSPQYHRTHPAKRPPPRAQNHN